MHLAWGDIAADRPVAYTIDAIDFSYPSAVASLFNRWRNHSAAISFAFPIKQALEQDLHGGVGGQVSKASMPSQLKSLASPFVASHGGPDALGIGGPCPTRQPRLTS